MTPVALVVIVYAVFGLGVVLRVVIGNVSNPERTSVIRMVGPDLVLLSVSVNIGTLLRQDSPVAAWVIPTGATVSFLVIVSLAVYALLVWRARGLQADYPGVWYVDMPEAQKRQQRFCYVVGVLFSVLSIVFAAL